MSEMSTLLKEIGLSEEELQNRVIDKIVSNFMTQVEYDEDGDEYYEKSKFCRGIESVIKSTVDAKISEIAEKHVLPNVSQYIENITLQETNQWGEKKGKALTFTEYLAERAENYLSEQVDHEGHSKSEKRDSYGWSGKQSRIVYLVNTHLQWSIQVSMQNAVKSANKILAEGLEETCKIQLKAISEKLKVEIKGVN